MVWQPLPHVDGWQAALYDEHDQITRVHPIGFASLREVLRAVDRLNARDAAETP